MRVALAVLLAFSLGLSAGCAKKKQTIEGPADASAEATFRKGLELLTKHELRQAITTLERIEYTTDSETRVRLEPLTRLALADATFYQNTDLGWIDARNLYLNFVTLYGNHPLAPYAQTQVGLCSLKQVSHPSRDQSQTLQAIADLQVVVDRYPESNFARAAKSLLRVARHNLAESEFLVGRFYLKRKAYSAAAERFRTVLLKYPEFVEADKVEFHLGKTLLLAGTGDEGRLILDHLVTEDPDGPFAQSARRLIASLE